MSYNWDKNFEGIGVVWEPKIVRVLNDDLLMERLKTDKRAYAWQIAKYARAEYEKRYGKELKITTKSLACEIYWHTIINIKSLKYEKKHGKKKLTQWLILHMDVIDCGEKDVDNNRFVWDLLAPFFGSYDK